MNSGPPTPKAAFHPRTAAHRDKGLGKLRLRDAVAMAVGGMIGGGIFSVLGVTVALAGHLAVGSFIIGGAIAMVTAHSFAALSARAATSTSCGGAPVEKREEKFIGEVGAGGCKKRGWRKPNSSWAREAMR